MWQHTFCINTVSVGIKKEILIRFKHLYLIFSTGQQLSTIRAESQTGDSSTVAPQRCKRLNIVVGSQLAQQPQNNGAVIWFKGKYRRVNNKTVISRKCDVLRKGRSTFLETSITFISLKLPEAVARYVEFCANARMMPDCTPNIPHIFRPPSIPSSPSLLFQTLRRLSLPADTSSSGSVCSGSRTTHRRHDMDTSRSAQIFSPTIKLEKKGGKLQKL